MSVHTSDTPKSKTIKLLVCAATQDEIRAFARDDDLWARPLQSDGGSWWCGDDYAITVTQVGIPWTLVNLPHLLTMLSPAAVLNIGIAGAYPNSGLAIGDIVMAKTETIGDIGFELPEEPGFQHVSAARFGRFYGSHTMAMLPAFASGLDGRSVRTAAGCTVNMCTGTESTGLMREKLFGAEFESMEGAAVAMACEDAGILACEVRAISNFAADRDMRPENIKLAIQKLREHLLACRRREGI